MLKLISSLTLVASLCVWGCGEAPREGPAEEAEMAGGSAAPLAPTDTVFFQELSWSPDGSSLLLSVLGFGPGPDGYTYQIYRVDADGSALVRLTDGPRDYWTSWSPDGSRIAFAALTDENLDIYVMAPDGTNRVRLTDDPAKDTHPYWFADGSRLVFTSDRTGDPQIYVMKADGSGVRQVSDVAGELWNPVPSPAGDRIVYYAPDESGEDYVYVMNLDGSDRTKLAPGLWPAWSPDGTRIIYAGEGGLFTMAPDGTGQRPMMAGDIGFGRYAPDGTRIAYIATDDGAVMVNVMNADGSGSRTLLRNPKPQW
ncbi:MAG: DUF5050 domain-containing protein [Gemmatimonadetes bacterium]|uniref:DUF5050 domain-containing protein n=1 Tax=Candidatus Kutchimonas denitrificans TaxID=3056748 RepID=A0AAE5CBI2_9BACT|nr:DUF5050 domain-containing protein [Gemmatimonadota bacterium]NIR75902.1 DUF5050 domain-containing protein [Candidatus Kutchimonas denitrificans]NIS02063.1 DUF5050 domain-containing protein [Gemmatimonadota bacterium]NIT67869.1 DUF5050 domain-containing protein [Gemmatimonadota bacterium]NIU53848.1 DUF5050 domain-containing protein [Gemmatimonadota bacterium]